MNLALKLLAAGLALGCAGKDPGRESTPAQPSESCRRELGERGDAEHLPREKTAPPSRPSRIVTHAELQLSRIKDELESKISGRLAEARGVGIGVAGSVNYTVDRGPFSLSVEGDSLVVKTDVTARAEACKSGRCYASCEPQAVARAEVPLRLDENYRFGPSRVTTTFTRGCKIRALRGFLTIDVTPTIQAQLEPELRKVEREIDRRLPRLQPQAKRLWAELAEPRKLPLGGCVVVQPRGIVQGPVSGTAKALRLSFGLLAEPEVRTQCGELPPATELPPLGQDPALPAEEEVRLGLVSPLTGVASAFRGAEAVKLADERVSMTRAAVSSAGGALDAELGLGGTVCGELTLRASPAWNEDGRSLRLVKEALGPRDSERVSAASLEPKALARALAAAPRIAVPLEPQALVQVVPLLASSQSSRELDVRARVTSVTPAEAAARGDDLVAWVRVKGRLDLLQK
jgi:hypothetical protein